MARRWPPCMPDREQRARARSICALICLLGPASAVGGAWVRAPGHALVKIDATYSEAHDPISDRAGVFQHATTFSLFAEVGLPFRFDLQVQVPYTNVNNVFTDEATYTNHSFGDAHFQLDRGLFSAVPLSIALDVKVPMYGMLVTRASRGTVEAGGRAYPLGSFPDIGNGAVELTPKLLFGWGFSARPIWVTAEVGYRGRLGGVQQGIYGAAGGGIWVWHPHLAFAAYGNFAYDFAGPAITQAPNGQMAAHRLYLALSTIVSLAPWVPWVKLFGSAGSAVLAANATTGFDVSGGVGVEY
jgi:hypothetical protein